MRKRTIARTLAVCMLSALVAGLWCVVPVYAVDASDIVKEITSKESNSEKSDTSKSGSTMAVSNYEYKLKKKATYKGDKSSLRFDDGSVVIKKGDGYQIVGTNGKLMFNGESFAECVYWGNGIYRVRSMDEDVNSNGLVTADGKELLPCEAGMIKAMTNRTEDARFAQVVYSTGETENEDECFFYIHEGLNIGYGPFEGDKLYKGYARIFDLQKGAFVEGIELEEPANLQDLGSTFVIKQGSVAAMYDESGQVVWSKDSGVSIYSRYVVWSEEGKSQLFDSTGKGRYSTSDSLDDIHSSSAWWSGDYVAEAKGSSKRVIDFDGNEVLKESYYYVWGYANGLFTVQKQENDDQRQIVALDGTVVVESTGKSPEPMLPGYNTYWVDAQNTGIVKGSDIIWKGPQDSKTESLIAEKGGKYLVLNDEKFSLALDTAEGLRPGLVKGRDADSVSYGVYDLFTGKRLLKEEYDDIKYGAGCVWAYANGSWTIYEVELQEK